MMTKLNVRKLLSLILCAVLIAAMALAFTGCADSENPAPPAAGDVTEVGEGTKSFHFTVVHMDGSQKQFLVHTDADIVGTALVDVGLIAGEDGPYGLYVKTVDSETLDYDTHGKYWAFYVGEESALIGVDGQELTDGASYAFKAE